MDSSVIVYIVFSVIFAMLVAIAVALAVTCKKWHDAYAKLSAKIQYYADENYKLQHEVYKLHYMTSKTNKKEGK